MTKVADLSRFCKLLWVCNINLAGLKLVDQLEKTIVDVMIGSCELISLIFGISILFIDIEIIELFVSAVFWVLLELAV